VSYLDSPAPNQGSPLRPENLPEECIDMENEENRSQNLLNGQNQRNATENPENVEEPNPKRTQVTQTLQDGK